MKIESVEEYLARGGTVEVIPPNGFKPKSVVKVRAGGSVMSLSEGEEMFGPKPKKEKVKASKKVAVDLSKIPSKLLEELRAMGEDV